MTRSDYKHINQELLYAQMDLTKASKILATVGIRLQDTKYYAEYKKAWNILFNLNDELIKEIKK